MDTPLLATARAVRTLEFSHGMLVKLVDAFPEERAAFQPSPTDNHLLWQLGHVALDYRWFAGALDGQPEGTTAEQRELFGTGSKPVPDAGRYPPLAVLRRDLREAWARLRAAAEGLREEDAGRAPLIDVEGMLEDRLDAVEKCAWHTGWHAGQLSGVRRALGLGPVWM